MLLHVFPEAGFRENIGAVTAGDLFAAENASVGASPVSQEERDDHGSSSMLSICSRAFRAAACSASFLFLPVPVAAMNAAAVSRT